MMAARDLARQAVRDYYEAFNSGDREAFLALLTPGVVHDINQGGQERGIEAFRRFLAAMDRSYKEQITDIVVMVSDDGTRAAAEFVVRGRYVADDPGVPAGTSPANGQMYVLAAGAFFTLDGGKITRISNYYNVGEWVRQVGS